MSVSAADVTGVDPYDRETVAGMLGIAPALAAEIAYVNDDDYYGAERTPEVRFQKVRTWVEEQIAGRRK